jgi:hypothetical protein
MRVCGLNAIGGQFLPPCEPGQNSVRLPVPGLCAGSTSGLPVFGSSPRKTFWMHVRLAFNELIGPLLRSRNQR